MKNHEIFNNRHAVKESHVETVNLKESSSNPTPNPELPMNSDTASYGGFLFVTFSLFLLACILTILDRFNLKNNIRNQLKIIGFHHKVPCSSCQFFNQNFYLKCAVNPSKVLSEEAINCPDYCSNKGKEKSACDRKSLNTND